MRYNKPVPKKFGAVFFMVCNMTKKYYIYFPALSKAKLNNSLKPLLTALIDRFNFNELGSKSTELDICTLIPLYVDNGKKNTWINFIKLILELSALMYYKKHVSDLGSKNPYKGNLFSLVEGVAVQIIEKLDPSKNETLIKNYDTYLNKSGSKYSYFFKTQNYHLFDFICICMIEEPVMITSNYNLMFIR